MRAVVYERYGSPDVLRLADVPKPAPGDGDVLVRVSATTVNRSDCGFLRAEPFIARLFSGLIRPRRPILGTEFAGEVEAVGDEVSSFEAGDRVFGLTGDDFGAHAEYVRVPEQGSIAHMPANTSYWEAASIPDGAMLASGCLGKSALEAGQRILIYGTTGWIGTAAVQLAKDLGAEITAVGKTSFWRCRALLESRGVYVETDLGFLWQNPALALVSRIPVGRRVRVPVPRHDKRLILHFKDLVERGALRPVIDRRYPLERIVDAYEYVETGEKTGNVVIEVA